MKTAHTTTLPTHNKHNNTQRKKGERTGQHEERGHHTNQAPRHSTRPPSERRGGASIHERGHQHVDGDTDIRRGVSNSAALHSRCHPPSAMPPHHPRWPHPPPRRGGSRQRIPHHTNSTDRHSPTHTTHLARNSVQHDCSTLTGCTGSRRRRSHALDWVDRK